MNYTIKRVLASIRKSWRGEIVMTIEEVMKNVDNKFTTIGSKPYFRQNQDMLKRIVSVEVFINYYNYQFKTVSDKLLIEAYHIKWG